MVPVFWEITFLLCRKAKRAWKRRAGRNQSSAVRLPVRVCGSFPKIRGTFVCGGPHDKDYRILGVYIGVPPLFRETSMCCLEISMAFASKLI